MAILTFLVGVLLVWFSNGGDRDSERPEGVRPGFSTWGHVKNQGADPFLKHDSNGLHQLSERESQLRPPTGAIGEFEDWMERFLSEDSSGRGQLIEEGVAISGRRRQEMKRLIQEDPETALALAVPYQFRREFPPEITARLETLVSNFAQFRLVVYCSDPGHAEDEHAGHDHAESEYERIATFGGNRYEAHTFGRRFNVTTKDLLSIHGIAIDEVLAMADDPVRVLSESERTDRGFDANIAVSVGGNVYGAADEEAVRRLRTTLEEDEGTLGPLPGTGYRALQREEVDGVRLLFAAEPDEDLNIADLSEMQSDHTLGPKTMLYIRARFSDQEEDFEPIDLETLKERQALCEKFWFENSYGKSSLTTTFTDTVTLPESANYYENNNYQITEDTLPLVKAAGEAKGEDWDSENYDFNTLLTPDGDWEYVGLAGVGDGSSTLFGTKASNVRTASHEFGHNLGLWHANYWRTDSTSPIGRDSIPGGYMWDEEGDEWNEYGHRFSIMGAQDNGGYYTEGRAHFTTGEKVELEWLVAEDGDWMSVDQTTATPIRLYRQDVESDDFDAILTGVTRAIKINLDSGDYAENDKRRYWLSYRLLPAYYDWGPKDWLPYGLQVDWQRETYGRDGSILLDMTPYTDDTRGHIDNMLSPHYIDTSDKSDAVVVIGRTYSDEVADIHFTPIARGGETPNEWIDVLINIGTQEENTAPEITSFTASSTTVVENEVVDFSVEAVDEDGDTLYYTWSFSNYSNLRTLENLNSETASVKFENAWKKNGNLNPVRVTVSDGKGGSDTRVIYVKIGDLSDSPAIRGRVIAGGFPVDGAIVKLNSEWEDEGNGITTESNAWTDQDGNYLLLHEPITENFLTAVKDGLRLEPLFSNPVYLNDIDAWGQDWVAIGDGPASGSLQLAVTPYQTEVPIGSQVDFEVLAWDPSGKRIEVNPVWSVSGGGTINDSGVFTANESGGPFRVTASQGSSEAHAIMRIPHNVGVSIVSLTPQVSESGLEDAVFRFERHGDTEGNLTVGFKAVGSATMEEDYVRLMGNIDIQDGESHVDLSIEILDDERVEPTENLVLSLRRSTHYSIFPNQASASIDILDDGDRAPVVQVTSPKRQLALVPKGVGLLFEAAIDDDGFPNPPGKSTVNWSVLKAPRGGRVFFSPPKGNATVATFSVPGYYTIQMTAYDGVNIGTETLDVYATLQPGDIPTLPDAKVYLTMDEGVGITTTDSQGGDNNGVLINGASWTGPGGGISGTGIILDGIDDQINIENPDKTYRIFRQERTIALWFKADDPLRDSKQTLYREGNQWRGLNIYLEAGKLYVGGWTSEGIITSEEIERQNIFLSTALVDTNWHHVALVLKKVGSGRNRSFYSLIGFLDGQVFESNYEDNLVVQTITAYYERIPTTLGANGGETRYLDGVANGPDDHFSGIVDEFQVWTEDLVPREIQLLTMHSFIKEGYFAPETALSSVDHSAGSVVVPPGMGIVLDGSATGKSSPETRWETVIAPEGGQTTFKNSSQPSTFATFSAPGYYKLRLSADDGIQKSAIDVDVHAGLHAGSNFSSPRELVYYSMDEGSGEIVGNNAGDEFHGKLRAGTSWTSQGGGISGTALQFHGIDDQLLLEDLSLLDTTAEKKSIAMWVKPNGIGTGEKEVIFQILNDYGGGMNIYLDGDVLYIGNRLPIHRRGASWLQETYLAVPITRGEWQHLALVLDVDELALYPNEQRAYLDGKQVEVGEGYNYYIHRPSLGTAADRPLFHDGYGEYNKGYGYSGLLDEFHYYQDHALTIDEIGMLYAFGNIGPTVYAGPDQSALPTPTVLLEGSSTDDGRWSSPVTYSWHILDGPGTGRFRPIGDNGASTQLDFFEGGTYRIALGAFDGQVTTFDELMVTVRQPTPFELFMHGFPTIAVEDRSYHADPDRDNWSNLVEYALGGAPDVGETYYQLGLQHELVREAGDWYAEFRYPRRRDAAQRGLRYEFQVSDDLSTDSWMVRGYTVLEVTLIDEIFEEVRLRIDESLDSANSRIFGRVRVIIEE